MKTVYTIDAKNKKLGRVATEAATALLGKRKAGYVRNRVSDVRVEIVNASKLAVSERKMVQKSYVRYSGYPGGLRREILSEATARRGWAQALRRAIFGMLPGNKLRPQLMKRLIISE
ncbi:50S ribosomal protein L13 [Patescibacteria group bacterium]|nr:MAG: 50S ribosomal protein L13 [Patescibacteria group bacterium]